jgi:hypothetical protein
VVPERVGHDERGAMVELERDDHGWQGERKMTSTSRDAVTAGELRDDSARDSRHSRRTPASLPLVSAALHQRLRTGRQALLGPLTDFLSGANEKSGNLDSYSQDWQPLHFFHTASDLIQHNQPQPWGRRLRLAAPAEVNDEVERWRQ